jgi:hypothetical protein
MSLQAVFQNLKDLGGITLPSLAATALYRLGSGRSMEQRGLSEGPAKVANVILGSLAGGITLYKLGQFCLREKRDSSKTPLQKVTNIVLMTTQVAAVLGVCLCVAKPLPSTSVFELHIRIDARQRNGSCKGQETLLVLQSSPHLPEHIVFEPSQLRSSISNGVCSAKSFEFANNAIRTCSTKSALEVDDCLRKVVESSKTILPKHRDRQVAFNCVTIDRIVPDHMVRKMQALANFHDLHVSPIHPVLPSGKEGSSVDAGMASLCTFLDQPKETRPSLEMYIFRDIIYNPAARKLEKFGHTTALAVTPDKLIYHDPASDGGFFIGPRTPAVLSAIQKGLQANRDEYKFSELGVFKLDFRENGAPVQEAVEALS